MVRRAKNFSKVFVVSQPSQTLSNPLKPFANTSNDLVNIMRRFTKLSKVCSRFTKQIKLLFSIKKATMVTEKLIRNMSRV